MVLFVESVLSLTLWFSSGKLLWFLRIGKQKAKNENGSKIKPEDANEKEEEVNEEAVSFYKVGYLILILKVVGERRYQITDG